MKKAFATNLRKGRAALGWNTQSRAAKHLGIPRTRYQSYEEGRANPSAECLASIMHIMGITDAIAFLSDPNFDYKNQDIARRPKSESPLMVNYREASDRDKKLVDAILGMPTE